MAILHPFKAFRPSSEQVKKVSCVPYDVISKKEARQKTAANKNNFLHVIRPEVDLPEDTAFNDKAVYQKGKENLQYLIQKGILKKDEDQTVYIYQLKWRGKKQTGIFGCVSVRDYDNEIILKHELTRPDKEDDRTRHILTQSAHAEPVMMTYKDDSSIKSLVSDTISDQPPLFDFTAEDQVKHTLWKVQDSHSLVKAFKKVENLYIADGHHRCKSASRAAEKCKKQNPDHTGKEEYNFFPAVIFPMSEMRILAYNRIIYTIPDNFASQIKSNFQVFESASSTPPKKGMVSLYQNGSWTGVNLPIPDEPNAVQKLDVHRLQKFILEPYLNIKDPRRDNNISFVGGIRGTDKLETMVDSGEAELAVSMYPTSIEELVEVSDEGLLMPPKSTWFEPKLRSGLIVHTF